MQSCGCFKFFMGRVSLDLKKIKLVENNYNKTILHMTQLIQIYETDRDFC